MRDPKELIEEYYECGMFEELRYYAMCLATRIKIYETQQPEKETEQ